MCIYTCLWKTSWHRGQTAMHAGKQIFFFPNYRLNGKVISAGSGPKIHISRNPTRKIHLLSSRHCAGKDYRQACLWVTHYFLLRMINQRRHKLVKWVLVKVSESVRIHLKKWRSSFSSILFRLYMNTVAKVKDLYWYSIKINLNQLDQF